MKSDKSDSKYNSLITHTKLNIFPCSLRLLTIVFLYYFFQLQSLSAQQNVRVSDVTSAPANPSSVLEVESTTKGMLVPRMTSAQRLAIVNPANSLLVYDTNLECFMYYTAFNTTWNNLCNNGNGGANAILTTQVDPGVNCNNGGVLLQFGNDSNGNGQLDPSEINSSLNQYVCNGINGATGPQGAVGEQGIPGPQGPIGLTGPQGPAGNGFSNGTTVNQMMYWNGTAWVPLNPGVNGQVLAVCDGNLSWVTLTGICNSATPSFPAGTVFCASGPTAIVDVTNPVTGKTWMDRNLGATQVATSSTDAASYGDLYQWGRGADGHQCRNSPNSSVLSSSTQPGNNSFIYSPNTPGDWLNPQNTNLWQGVNGVNNPCPSGYRLPTDIELDNERLSWVQPPINSSNNSVGAFTSPLKFPLAGRRNPSNGALALVGTYGYYWSSTIYTSNPSHSRMLVIFSNSNIGASSRAAGYSVRCIKGTN